ncbi:hypothetical protein GETHLI_30450 [Geothrix limicola]|uniref:PAS domain-containing protein n=1 Tax=Geothrix limicola TaxID=2927978 RepID=A0ABQ5QIN4_9BACT|nr:hypothetical protein [Geothrix limicola]GLH74543.1 hypothetical protein GETHLI_30450 [Geothrix limicola]
MKHICAWCNAELGELSTLRHPQDSTSHGICLTCLRDLERGQGMELLALVEELPHVLLAIDQDLRIRAANQLACDLLHAEWAWLLGRRLDDVIDCERVHEPDESPDLRPCSKCGLQRLVMHTLQSGKSGSVSMTRLETRSPHALPVTTHRAISLRVGDLVALRIDPVHHTTIVSSPHMDGRASTWP